LSITEHLEMDDSDVIFHMKQWQASDDKVLRDLSQRFVGRRLFKAIDLDMPEAERQEFLEAARAVVINGGFMPEYYFIEDRASDVPYYGYYTPKASSPGRASMLRMVMRVRSSAKSARSARRAGLGTRLRAASNLFPGGSKRKSLPALSQRDSRPQVAANRGS